MKERPILFSGPMVRAILDGRKTQTRRIVKQQPLVGNPARCVDHGLGWAYESPSGKVGIFGTNPGKCPYGEPGDQLWVREAFNVYPSDGCTYGEMMMGKKLTVSYPAGGLEKHLVGGSVSGPGFHADYAAADYNPDYYGTNRPSIHMPRWASRITLEVTGVRCERLQGITEQDAWAEGFPDPPGENQKYGDRARYWFQTLWESINGPGSREANPWVWAVEFRRIKP